ncbi:MAG: hypothetical protein H8E51_06955 [Bacteroidetes bacterium]|nr:hypothetical protein [Bacteroidota bacterium]
MAKHISDYIELPGLIVRSDRVDTHGNPLSDKKVLFVLEIDNIGIIREEPDENDELTRTAISDKQGNYYTVLMDYRKLKHYLERVKINHRKQQLLTLRQ